MKRRSFFGGLAALFAAPFLLKDSAPVANIMPEPVKLVEPKWVKLTPRVGKAITTHLSHAKDLLPGVEFTGLPKYVYAGKEANIYLVEEELNVSDKLVTLGFGDLNKFEI
jgi:hypothetical protein